MAKTTPPINSLNGGEIFSDLLDSRFDIDKYKSACKVMQNAFPLVEGGARKMPGTYYVAPAKYPDKKCRLVPFSFSTSQNYTLEFGDKYVRFFTDDGQIVGPPGPSPAPADGGDYDPSTAYVANDPAWVGNYWTVDCGAGKKFYISAPYGMITKGLQFVAIGVPLDTMSIATSGDFPNVAIAIQLANATASLNTATAIEAALNALAVTKGFDFSDFKVTANAAYAAAPVIVLDIVYCGYGTLSDGGYVALQSNQYTFFPPSEATYWKVSQGATHDIPEQIIEVTTPYLEADLFELDLGCQSNDVIYDFHRAYPPAKLMRYSHTYWTLQNLACIGTTEISKVGAGGIAKTITAITNASTAVITANNHNLATGQTVYINHVLGMLELNQGQFTVSVVDDNSFQLVGIDSTDYGTYDSGGWVVGLVPMFRLPGDYPTCGCIFQQRLYLGGSDNHPLRFYGSVQGDFENFTSDPEEDDMAVQFDLDSQTQDRIRWMTGKKQLLIGTASCIKNISGSNGPITATNPPNIDNALTIGTANGVAPQQVNESMIWVECCTTVVRLLQYDWQSDQWIGPDLTRLARHIAKGIDLASSGIIQTGFQSSPYPIFWAIRADGVLIGMTYESQETVYAWFRNITDGAYESLCSLRQDADENKVWISVKRTIGGSDVRYIEYFMPHEFFGKIEDAFFVHCGLSTTFTIKTREITGLDHLEGETVAILADGRKRAPQVVTGGKVTIGLPALKVTVGLPYDYIVKPMNPMAGSNQGTSRGKKQKINRVTLGMYQSAGGQIGIDEDNLMPIVYPNAIGTLFTGDIANIDIQGDWRDDDTIMIKNSDPLPFTLKLIVPHVTVDDTP